MIQETPLPAQPGLRTGILHSDLFLEHDTGSEHPESPSRCKVIVQALRAADFAERLEWLAPRPADREDLMRCHFGAYIELVRREIVGGASQLSTGDTAVGPRSWDAAVYAAGGACLAVDSVVAGTIGNAFGVLRPPGHHATPGRGMGFCVFNNTAVAARYAQQRHGIGKVLIVDWDVHHGNGTQDAFYQDDTVFVFSTHQWPWYPGTGAREETGYNRGLGTNMNRPFPAGAGRREILGAFADDLLDAARKFKPELVLISAGFDSRVGDPLGDFRLTDDDFADLTRLTLDLADECAEGRVVSLLEGGYDLDGLASSVKAHCRVLADRATARATKS
ncbi:MAG: histone deacetylase [Candidatus Anammoximicrobium sp.]|nr:histone deacetylase [Candidatus Anammoximicrobium sp.]